jgi:hypothetical protein
VLFNTKLTPSVKHRILALISPKSAVLTKRQHLVNPRNAATGNREIRPQVLRIRWTDDFHADAGNIT